MKVGGGKKKEGRPLSALSLFVGEKKIDPPQKEKGGKTLTTGAPIALCQELPWGFGEGV